MPAITEHASDRSTKRLFPSVRGLAGPVLLLACAVFGATLSVWMPKGDSHAPDFIVPFLVGVLFCLFARVSLSRLRDAGRDLYFLGSALVLNFVVTPLLALLLGWLFLRHWPELWVGLILVLITPCTDWYLIFTRLAGGDLPRNVALLPWNLVLQLLLLPGYLLLLTGQLVPLDWAQVVRAVGLFVAAPLAAAQLFRWRWPRAAASATLSRLGWFLLGLAVVAMFWSRGHVLLGTSALLWRLIPPLLSFYLLAVFLAWQVSRRLAWPHSRFVALACTAVARNSPLTLPLALVLFPASPAVALSQLVEPVVEIPSLILLTAFLRKQPHS